MTSVQECRRSRPSAMECAMASPPRLAAARQRSRAAPASINSNETSMFSAAHSDSLGSRWEPVAGGKATAKEDQNSLDTRRQCLLRRSRDGEVLSTACPSRRLDAATKLCPACLQGEPSYVPDEQKAWLQDSLNAVKRYGFHLRKSIVRRRRQRRRRRRPMNGQVQALLTFIVCLGLSLPWAVPTAGR